MNYRLNKIVAWLGVGGLALTLGGCGGGTASTTVSGNAMAGPFLSGTVCAYQVNNGAKGAALGTCSNITTATSSFSVNFTDYTGDVLLELTNATYDDEANPNDNVNGTPLVGRLRSIVNVSGSGTVSVAITPLTEAAIRMAGSLSSSAAQTAAAQLRALFPVSTQLDLFTTLPTVANTSSLEMAYHEALRALSQLQWGTNGNGAYAGNLDSYLTNLLSQIGSAPNTVASNLLTQMNSGLDSNCSISNNLISCTLPSSGGGTGASGNYTLTITVAISGIGTPAIILNNVPKPADQAAFCSDATVQSALSNANTNGGTLTINSCSFNGTTGTISATVTITSPFSMSIPYTATYTYSANSGSGGSGGNGGAGGAGGTGAGSLNITGAPASGFSFTAGGSVDVFLDPVAPLGSVAVHSGDGSSVLIINIIKPSPNASAYDVTGINLGTVAESQVPGQSYSSPNYEWDTAGLYGSTVTGAQVNLTAKTVTLTNVNLGNLSQIHPTAADLTLNGSLSW